MLEGFTKREFFIYGYPGVDQKVKKVKKKKEKRSKRDGEHGKTNWKKKEQNTKAGK